MHSTTSWLKAAVVTLVAFFAPIHKLLILTTVLIAVDFVTGIVAAVKTKQSITSSKLSKSVVKILVYSVALCTCFLVEQNFVPEIPIVRMLAALVGLTEATSILENLNIASGQNLLTALMLQLKTAQDKLPVVPDVNPPKDT